MITTKFFTRVLYKIEFLQRRLLSPISEVPSLLSARDTGPRQRCIRLRHCVPGGGPAEEVGTHFGRPLLRLEIHVNDSEPVAVAGGPLEVVH